MHWSTTEGLTPVTALRPCGKVLTLGKDESLIMAWNDADRRQLVWRGVACRGVTWFGESGVA